MNKCLPDGVTATDDDVRTVAKGRCMTRKPDRRATDLVGLSNASQRVAMAPTLCHFGVRIQLVRDKTSTDVTRGNCVYANAVGAPFGGQVATKLQKGRLGGIVGGGLLATVCHRARHRSNKNDRSGSMLLRLHYTSSGLGSNEGTSSVHFNHFPELVHVIVQGRVGLQNACTSHAYIQGTSIGVLTNVLHDLVNFLLISHISRDIFKLSIQEPTVLCHALELVARLFGEINNINVSTGFHVGKSDL